MTIDMKDFLSAVTDVLHRIDYIKAGGSAEY